MVKEMLMEIKLLAVLMVLIEKSESKGYLTQKQIADIISSKYLKHLERKSIASAIATLEDVFRQDIKNLLGYDIVRGPQNKGVSVVKLNESSFKKTSQ